MLGWLTALLLAAGTCCCPGWAAVTGPSGDGDVVLLDPRDLGYLPPPDVEDNRCGINIPSTDPLKERVHIGEYPWMALIGYTRASKKSKRIIYSCGGTLINSQYVLTAAHCVTRLPKDLRVTSVRLGEHNITTEQDCEMTGGREVCSEPVQDYKAEEVISHPEHHKPRQYHNDIALIRLDRPVQRTDFVRPICLPFDSSLRRDYIGKTVTVAGFGTISGQSDAVRELHVPLVDNEKCAKAFQRYRTAIGSSQLCAGGERGRGACSGDAGGPLMATAAPGQPHVIVGVVSFGPARCGTKDVPDVYTRVADYKEWIVANMRS